MSEFHQGSFTPEQGETLPIRSTMRDALVAATLDDPHRALSPAVQEIDLIDQRINLQEEVVNQLRVAARRDPQGREHGKELYVTNDHKLRVHNAITVGSETSHVTEMQVRGQVTYVRGERLILQDKYVAAIPHTHPVELPFSGIDLIGLFRDGESFIAATAAWIVTPRRTAVAFRGPDTPELSEAECQQKVALWHRAVEERITRHLRPGMNQVQVLELNQRVQLAFIGQVATKYGLQLFTGGENDSVLKRTSSGL